MGLLSKGAGKSWFRNKKADKPPKSLTTQPLQTQPSQIPQLVQQSTAPPVEKSPFRVYAIPEVSMTTVEEVVLPQSPRTKPHTTSHTIQSAPKLELNDHYNSCSTPECKKNLSDAGCFNVSSATKFDNGRFRQYNSFGTPNSEQATPTSKNLHEVLRSSQKLPGELNQLKDTQRATSNQSIFVTKQPDVLDELDEDFMDSILSN